MKLPIQDLDWHKVCQSLYADLVREGHKGSTMDLMGMLLEQEERKSKRVTPWPFPGPVSLRVIEHMERCKKLLEQINPKGFDRWEAVVFAVLKTASVEQQKENT